MLGIQDRKFSTHFSSFKQGESFLCHNFLEKKNKLDRTSYKNESNARQ